MGPRQRQQKIERISHAPKEAPQRGEPLRSLHLETSNTIAKKQNERVFRGFSIGTAAATNAGAYRIHLAGSLLALMRLRKQAP